MDRDSPQLTVVTCLVTEGRIYRGSWIMQSPERGANRSRASLAQRRACTTALALGATRASALAASGEPPRAPTKVYQTGSSRPTAHPPCSSLARPPDNRQVLMRHRHSVLQQFFASTTRVAKQGDA
eukprot:2430979-Prymnesium_polylepis.2